MKDQYAVYLCKPPKKADFYLFMKPVYIHVSGANTYSDAYEMSESGDIVITENLAKAIRSSGQFAGCAHTKARRSYLTLLKHLSI
jgi:hypothetical protein